MYYVKVRPLNLHQFSYQVPVEKVNYFKLAKFDLTPVNDNPEN